MPGMYSPARVRMQWVPGPPSPSHWHPDFPRPRRNKRAEGFCLRDAEKLGLLQDSARWRGLRCSATEEGLTNSSMDELEKGGLEKEILRRPPLLNTVEELRSLEAMEFVQVCRLAFLRAATSCRRIPGLGIFRLRV